MLSRTLFLIGVALAVNVSGWLLCIFVGVGDAEAAGLHSELERQFESNFKALRVPNRSEIMEGGESKQLPYKSFDQVWAACLVVLMQEGIVVRALKDEGVIIVVGAPPPRAVFVSSGRSVTVYIKRMDDLYSVTDEQGKKSVDFRDVLEKISTQVYAEDRWKYLFK